MLAAVAEHAPAAHPPLLLAGLDDVVAQLQGGGGTVRLRAAGLELLLQLSRQPASLAVVLCGGAGHTLMEAIAPATVDGGAPADSAPGPRRVERQ